MKLWERLGKPEGHYATWSRKMWDAYGLETLGRPWKGDSGISAWEERGFFITKDAGALDRWLEKKFETGGERA
jgi:hypothetical protein